MGERLRYQFEQFVLDPVRRKLHRAGEELLLSERGMAVLQALVENAGEVVEKSELMHVAWPEAVVLEDNLVQAIHDIRNVLADNPRRPVFVQTVHRRGYRFVAPVSALSEDSERSTHERPPAPSQASPRRRRLVAAGLLTALGALVVVTVLVGGRATRQGDAPGPGHLRAIAVLPLENLSGDPEQEYFADGMTDALITTLSKIRSLQVIARTSVMRYKGTRARVSEIARELDVDAVVEGSVLRAGNRVRISARMIDPVTERHMWADDYESDLKDLLSLQNQAARAIAREVEVRMTPEERERLSGRRALDPAAHEAYLRGRHLLEKRTRPALLRSIEYFEHALARDPEYALAHVGIADAHFLMANYGFARPTEVQPLARSAALAALLLDDDLAEAHASLAAVKQEYEWDFAGAGREYRRALTLNPNDASAHHWYALHLGSQGRVEEAMAEIRQAQRLDPLSLIINANAGRLLFISGRGEEAVLQLQRTLELDPSFPVAYFYLGQVHEWQGRLDAAFSAFEKARSLSQDSSYTVAALGHCHAVAGHDWEARQLLEHLRATSREDYVSPVSFATVHLGLGELDEAFEWLERGYEERKGWLSYAHLEPVLDVARPDPRFIDLVRRIGLPLWSPDPQSGRGHRVDPD